MNTRSFLCGLVVAAGASSAMAAAVTFDTAATPAGTTYGSPTLVNGQFAFAEDGIDVRVATFTSGAFSTLNEATILTPGIFPTRSSNMNNLQFVFDFTGLPFIVTQVSFEYNDGGGTNNIGANNGYIETNDLTSLPAFINGVSVTSTATLVTFSSAAGINNLVIGGQELVIDTIRAIPTPSAAMVLGLGALAAGRRRR